eukprot:CAMPEP_0183336856 /NCGR_PEP_ID=MMETSP0164_2-20130417/4710_1 /TAXON_ID=221442 /ORGANISM="Coccolithus pelagicus ssp braarudi, Strain PLY182g" /LENGTH=231 /DNA_ID=CAMNT_0025506463 /DNA_START=292 /DNA_END=988 /DNA_ORIENTATION=+
MWATRHHGCRRVLGALASRRAHAFEGLGVAGTQRTHRLLEPVLDVQLRPRADLARDHRCVLTERLVDVFLSTHLPLNELLQASALLARRSTSRACLSRSWRSRPIMPSLMSCHSSTAAAPPLLSTPLPPPRSRAPLSRFTVARPPHRGDTVTSLASVVPVVELSAHVCAHVSAHVSAQAPTSLPAASERSSVQAIDSVASPLSDSGESASVTSSCACEAAHDWPPSPQRAQ